jgi:hypothetical protein
MRPRLRLDLLTAVLSALTAQPAAAQWSGAATYNFGMGMGPIAMMVGQQALGRQTLENARAHASGPRTRAPTAADAARFDFTRSPEVSQAMREQMVAAMSAANPGNRPILEKAFAGDAVFVQFKALAARYGLSATNVVDVMATYSLVTWKVATGGTDAGASSARAVRSQLLHAALDNAAMQKTSNADRQKLAEALAYQVVMETILNDAISRQGDAAKLQALRAMVREAAMHVGPDPTTLKLTEAGLVPAP